MVMDYSVRNAKIRHLEARADYEDQWETSVRVMKFEGGKLCYVFSDGRVVWPQAQPTLPDKPQQKAESAKKCALCSGMGWCTDAEPGDISFNTWKCSACKGSGRTDPAPSVAEKAEWPTAMQTEPPEGVDLIILADHAGYGPWIGRWNAILQIFSVAQPSDISSLGANCLWREIDYTGLQRPEAPELSCDAQYESLYDGEIVRVSDTEI